MAYVSRGRRPIERASKLGQAEIINDPDVQAFLAACELPSAPGAHDISPYIHPAPTAPSSPIRIVIAIDGGFTEAFIKEDFPSVSLTFFCFGPLLLKIDDLRQLDRQRFLAPEDMQKLKQIERYKFVLPTRGVRKKGESSLVTSVRHAVYDFFAADRGGEKSPFLETTRWFLFRRWKASPDPTQTAVVTHCPYPPCTASDLGFTFAGPTAYACPSCGRTVYLTDVFRLQERVDEEQGAGGIQPQLMLLLEQIVLIHTIRKIWEIKRGLLAEVLFVKDGPLAFFDVVAPLHKPMQELFAFLLDQPALSGAGRQAFIHAVGVEKSGSWVDHAAAIESRLPERHILIPDNAYIYRYIIPGDPSSPNVYGHNTYYGQKLIYRSQNREMYVLTIPTRTFSAAPTISDFANLPVILQHVAELRCHMYDNALLPVALANKLVSLSEYPSQRLLTHFASAAIS